MKGSSALQISLLNFSERVKDHLYTSGVADTVYMDFKNQNFKFFNNIFPSKNEVREKIEKWTSTMCPGLTTEQRCHFCRDESFLPRARVEIPELEDLDE